MSELLIKNAVVCDPLNNINCEKMDLSVKDGKIVESVSSAAKLIDAGGKLTMAGGFDGHTHCAGKINVGRFMSPHDMRMNPIPGLSGKVAPTATTRAQVGYNTPNTFAIGYRYSKLGYTTITEAAIPILAARHTHEEFESIPILDKLGLTLFSSNWQVMEYIRDNEPDKLAAYVAWALRSSRGYGIKIVNPGGGEAWGWAKNVSGLDDPVPNFDVTPAQILLALAEANEKLNLPHSIHIHCNNLGKPGNYETTIASMKLLENVKTSRDRQAVHVTHVQFNAYAGTGWRDFETGAPMVADYINGANHLTFDLGMAMFGPAMTMTADGPLEYANSRLLHAKWSNQDVELEEASGVVPVTYSSKNFVNAVQWAIGQELALLVKDPWKVMFTTDSPNGGTFVNYPEAYTLLMSAKKRAEIIEGLPELAIGRMALPGIDRELDLYELAIMTRAIQSKMYGMATKGNLGVGADADIAIYDINPDSIDTSVEHEAVKKAFSGTAYTIKSGEIIVKDGEIAATPEGKTYWVNATVPKATEDAMMVNLVQKFKRYYSVNMANYMVEDAYLPHPVEIKTEAI
ncbi:MAG: formylmethanofuran dehydrogenase subunit A [Methanosarcinaceae archaeon]|nr:formylmethanofuran dehydrogenase subunit A [Methanosarcinaceae archaeon]